LKERSPQQLADEIEKDVFLSHRFHLLSKGKNSPHCKDGDLTFSGPKKTLNQEVVEDELIDDQIVLFAQRNLTVEHIETDYIVQRRENDKMFVA